MNYQTILAQLGPQSPLEEQCKLNLEPVCFDKLLLSRWSFPDSACFTHLQQDCSGHHFLFEVSQKFSSCVLTEKTHVVCCVIFCFHFWATILTDIILFKKPAHFNTLHLCQCWSLTPWHWNNLKLFTMRVWIFFNNDGWYLGWYCCNWSIDWSDEPVKCLPVLLSHCDEHLVGAVQLLSILHPHDVRFSHSLNSAAESYRISLRHRLIGWMFCKQHSCRRNVRALKQDTTGRTLINTVKAYPLRCITKQRSKSRVTTSSLWHHRAWYWVLTVGNFSLD